MSRVVARPRACARECRSLAATGIFRSGAASCSLRSLRAAAIACTLIAFAVDAEADTTRLAPTAVVATSGASDAAWPLALSVYTSPRLRSRDVDDSRARVLAGEPPVDRSEDLRDLADLRAAVRGDDAGSRQVLTVLAERLHLDAVIVVFVGPPVTARVFSASTHKFDGVRYEPDSWSTPASPSWDSALESMLRGLTVVSATGTASTTDVAEKVVVPSKKSKAFYESPWFWVAVGVATLAGGGVLIATTVQTSDAIHLQMHLP